VPNNGCAGCSRSVQSIVLRPIVYHNNQINEWNRARGTNCCANPIFFVLGGDNDSYTLIFLGHGTSL